MKQQIKIRGARAGGLAAAGLDLPLGTVVGFVGRAGSGRRAMAMEVLYGESRRRYMQALAPVEREGLSGVGQVDVDEVSGLPPAIYLGRERRGRTVGDCLQLDQILAQLVLDQGVLHCGGCGGVCRSFQAAEVEAAVAEHFAENRCLILAPLPLRQGGDWPSLWAELRRAGFLRVQVGGEVMRLDDAPENPGESAEVRVVVDRLQAQAEGSVRFLEAVRTARSIALGLTLVQDVGKGKLLTFNQQPTCDDCGRRYEEFSPQDLANHSAGDCRVLLHGHSLVELRHQPLADLQSFAIHKLGAGVAGEKLRDNLAEAMRLGVGGLGLDRPLDSLSAGEWQRLQLAAALCSGLTGILYICEGLGLALDRQRAQAMGDGIARLAARGNTVLLLDHDPHLLARAEVVWSFAAGSPQRVEGAWVPEDTMPTAGRHGAADAALSIGGTGALGVLQLEFRIGAFNCLSGPSGAGKTRVMHEVVVPILKGRKNTYETSGAGRNNRVVELSARRSRRTVLDELGVFAAIADLYAAAPAAQSGGYGREHFLLDRPGGRCTRCEGSGRHYFDLEFLEDISQLCEACGGRKYRDEIAEITLRGVGIADVLAMSIARASRHFARVAKVHERLAAAERCGLGNVVLGRDCRDLEEGEWLRLRLSVEWTRASTRTWVLVDNPAGGDHPADLADTIYALRELVKRGATAIVADQHEAIVAAADHIALMPGAKGIK
ncbi:MAG: hypothetical protein CME20_23030 [Gemmatimonadetes bacterium]|nr:hypothetical protein [Gemmatimonadota bacterium]